MDSINHHHPTQRLTCDVLESCEIFNSLFGGITTIRSQYHNITGIRSILPTHEVDISTFSPDQKHAIKQLGGLLMDMMIVLPSNTDEENKDISKVELDQPNNNHILIIDQNLLERKQKRTISALQDYLSQELTRAEELESKLQAKEMELVHVVAERDMYMKKYQQVNLNSSSQIQSKAIYSSQSNQPVTSSITKLKNDDIEVPFNPQEWVGRYIRKAFGSSYYFGIVVYFDTPYFKVLPLSYYRCLCMYNIRTNCPSLYMYRV